MSKLLINEPAIRLGLMAWLGAALLLPFQLGSGGASLWSLLAYLLVAGALFCAGKGVLGLADYRGLGDLAYRAIGNAIAMAVPALLAFTLGSMLSDEVDDAEQDLCRLGGFTASPSGDGDGIEADSEIWDECDVLPD